MRVEGLDHDSDPTAQVEFFLKTGLTKGKYSAKLVSSSKSFVSQQTEDLRIKGRGAGPLVVLKEPNEMCQYDKGRAEGPCTKVFR